MLAVGDRSLSVRLAVGSSDGSLRGGGCASSRRARRTRCPRPAALAELDPRRAAGSACGSATVDGEGVGKAALERRQAARLGPHPVGDRRREAERLRRQRVHVDRVAVAGDGGVAAAEVAAELPLGARPAHVVGPSPSGVRSPSATGPLAGPLAAAQHRADALPDQLAADARLGEQGEGPAAWVRLERGRADAQRQLLADRRSAGAGRSGSRRGRGRRRRTGSCRRPSPPCAAGRRARAGRWGAGGRAARSRRPWRRRRRASGSARTPARSARARGSRRRRPARRAAARRRGSSAPRRARRAAGCWAGCRACGSSSHAPSRLWPQTRTTLPLTPVEAGAGEPGDRLGDVDRQAALGEAAHPPARLRAGRSASPPSSGSR